MITGKYILETDLHLSIIFLQVSVLLDGIFQDG